MNGTNNPTVDNMSLAPNQSLPVSSHMRRKWVVFGSFHENEMLDKKQKETPTLPRSKNYIAVRLSELSSMDGLKSC